MTTATASTKPATRPTVHVEIYSDNTLNLPGEWSIVAIRPNGCTLRLHIPERDGQPPLTYGLRLMWTRD